ncbi:hypothetical protein DFH27DRAFT_233850 [Peziza echinospora]|nr:hypothetical protein DFH27DRAFT_233850 [Peziza echinospora]
MIYCDSQWRCVYRPNMDQTLPRLAHIRDTFNNVVLNHQWLYFPPPSQDAAGDGSGGDDSDSIRTTTPSLYSNLRSRFGPQQQPRVVGDGGSEYSVNTFTTTTTTRDRMSRNKGALDMDSMVCKFQEAAGGQPAVPGGRGGLPDSSAFPWRTKADHALLMLMHWVYEARLGLQPFLDYHITYAGPNASPGQLAQEPLPVQGYVNLIKAAWMLQIIDPAKAPLSADLGAEGRTLIGLLTCEVINLFQVIHEHEFDLPSAEATLAQGNYTVVVEGLPERRSTTPTRKPSSAAYGGDRLGENFRDELARSGVTTGLPSLVLSLENKNESSGSSSAGSASGNPPPAPETLAAPRGRPAAPESLSAEAQAGGSASRERGSSVGSKLEGRGRARGHWRSFSSSFSSDHRERQQSAAGIAVPAPAPPPEKALSSIYHRRPSTSASASSTPAPSSVHQNAFARVFSPFSSSLPSSKSTRQRSRSPSPLPPPGSRDPAQGHRASQSSTYNPPANTQEPVVPPSPSSARAYIFPKLPFPTSSRERERNRSGLITGSLVSLTGSIAEALGDKTRGVYATKPLPSLTPLPVQAAPPPPTNHSRILSSSYDDASIQRDREAKYFGASRNTAGYRWNERETIGTLGGAREGETEIMPKHLDDILVLTSYTGELHGGRWDNCRVRIYTRQAPGPNGAFGTNVRIVTVNHSMEGSVDQRNLFLENTELVPEYAYHDNWPVIYLRGITTGSRRRERKNSARHIHKQIAATASSSNVTTFQQPGIGWDECSLYYRFSTLRDMFMYQQALLGEVVETDMCVPHLLLDR